MRQALAQLLFCEHSGQADKDSLPFGGSRGFGRRVFEDDAVLSVEAEGGFDEQGVVVVVCDLAAAPQDFGGPQKRKLRVALAGPLGAAGYLGLPGSLLGCLAGARSCPTRLRNM